MNITFKNSVSAKYMVFKDTTDFNETDFAVRMLSENRIDGFLSFDHECINGKTDVIFDISSKHGFDQYHEPGKLGFTDLKKLIYDINSIVKLMGEYLLDPDNVVMKRECIYIEPLSGKYLFCYYPFYNGNLVLELKELFVQLLTCIDYEDRKAVRLIYDIQKAIQADNFTPDELVKLTGMITAEQKEPEQPQTIGFHNKYNLENVPADEVAEKSFFKKAGRYFKESDPGEIFDDINELKILKKIRKYEGKEKKPLNKALSEDEKLPDEILDLMDRING